MRPAKSTTNFPDAEVFCTVDHDLLPLLKRQRTAGQVPSPAWPDPAVLLEVVEHGCLLPAQQNRYFLARPTGFPQVPELGNNVGEHPLKEPSRHIDQRPQRSQQRPDDQARAQRVLGPLIDYDLNRGGDLLAVLAAVLAHPTSRTAAARASHLSRSVFCHRIEFIADLLGADLTDGETLASLHVAMLAASK